MEVHSATNIGFPGSSAGKEFACNAGDTSSIPGSRRSPGEGISYPLQYSWASFVAWLVKNLLAMWETWVQSLDWEDPLDKGMATHSTILAWKTPWTVRSMESKRVRHDRVTLTSLRFHNKNQSNKDEVTDCGFSTHCHNHSTCFQVERIFHSFNTIPSAQGW